jgi:cytochrome c peroxidase
VWELESAVEIMSTAQLGTELTAEEVDAITTFLRALTGDQPDVDYPLLPPSSPTTPRPDLSVTIGEE